MKKVPFSDTLFQIRNLDLAGQPAGDKLIILQLKKLQDYSEKAGRSFVFPTLLMTVCNSDCNLSVLCRLRSVFRAQE